MDNKSTINLETIRALLIVLPIVIQNLLSAAVGSADVIMLNYVGQSSISAASLATQYGSIIFMIYFGIGTGVTILSAQYFGKGDIQTIEKSRRNCTSLCTWCFTDLHTLLSVHSRHHDESLYQ